MERKNLGTKATRSSIIDTLFDRGYLDGKSIKATPLGLKLIEALEKYSSVIIDENLTKEIEEEMEKLEALNKPKELEALKQKVIAKAEKVITDISKEFKTKELEIGNELQKGLQVLRDKETETNTIIKCPTCSSGDLRILYNRKSKRSFVACSAYPECKQTYSLPPNSLIKVGKDQCESCKYPRLLAIKKGRKPWPFCFNPECEIVKEKRAKWEARKAKKP